MVLKKRIHFSVFVLNLPLTMYFFNTNLYNLILLQVNITNNSKVYRIGSLNKRSIFPTLLKSDDASKQVLGAVNS